VDSGGCGVAMELSVREGLRGLWVAGVELGTGRRRAMGTSDRGGRSGEDISMLKIKSL
jgi:hypothetical protein